MRIAVISDTHDHLHKVPLEPLGAADEIWHLGDVCAPEFLATLGRIGPPLRIVRGNCDSEYSWPHFLHFTLVKVRFHLIHIPPEYAPPGTDILLHGHTHQPRDEMVRGTRMLNPGSAGLANKGAPLSMGWLTLSEDRFPEWEIALLR